MKKVKKMSEYHNPVMVKECLEGLNIESDGTYVDVTFGGGGHSKEILKRLTTGRLIAFDRDKETGENAQKLARANTRSFTFIESDYRYIEKYLRLHGITKVDGILADLGVSSYQFDEPKRGFTIRAEGMLDMRMDQTAIKTAKEVVNEYDEKSLIHILSAYGEIKNARTLAKEIVNFRIGQSIEMTSQLKAIAMKNAPKGRHFKYFAQVFQAIRIEVNDELNALKEFLIQTGKILKEEGRLVVMSYHSLEDRLVKNFIKKGNIRGIDEKDFYGNSIRILDSVNRKIIVPGMAEIKENNRAKSAKLRIGKKR